METLYTKIFDTLTASWAGQVVVMFVAGGFGGWIAHDRLIARPRHNDHKTRIAAMQVQLDASEEKCARENAALRKSFEQALKRRDEHHAAEMRRIDEQYEDVRQLQKTMNDAIRNQLVGLQANEHG